MSYRNSFSYGGGRASPYAPRLNDRDRSFSDLFEYVQPEEVSVPFEHDDAPDVVHVKYMGSAFSLDFPPYSISESSVTVQDLRRKVADRLGEDHRRVRLLYKERELKFDPYPIKRYGCKQNSEIAVVVTEQLNDYSGGLEAQTHHSSEDDSASSTSLKPPTEPRRPRGNSSVRHRGPEYRSSESGSYLHPNGYSSRDEHRERRDSKRSTSPAPRAPRTRSRSPAPPQTTPAPRPQAPPADPNSPMGKVQALQNEYYDKWLPACKSFLMSPPADKTLREKENRRLSESVMKHIIETADAIELQGDQDARAERKKVLQEAQELLQKMDSFKKSY